MYIYIERDIGQVLGKLEYSWIRPALLALHHKIYALCIEHQANRASFPTKRSLFIDNSIFKSNEREFRYFAIPNANRYCVLCSEESYGEKRLACFLSVLITDRSLLCTLFSSFSIIFSIYLLDYHIPCMSGCVILWILNGEWVRSFAFHLYLMIQRVAQNMLYANSSHSDFYRYLSNLILR